VGVGHREPDVLACPNAHDTTVVGPLKGEGYEKRGPYSFSWRVGLMVLMMMM